jgi:hypothetical protein
MRITAALILVALVATEPALAREKVNPLPEAAAATLAGKSLAVTRRGVLPSFMAMTAGKATFALIGAAAMASDGNHLVKDNNIPDPADTVEAVLIPAFIKQYNVTPPSQPGHLITPGNDLKQIIGAAPGADLIVDIRSIGWNFAYYPTHWATYWVGYGVEVQLIDAKSAKVLADARCGSDTRNNAAPPSRESLTTNNAQLLKDVLSNLSWDCSRQLASDEFHIAPGNLAEMPATLADPLGNFAAQAHGQATPAAATPAATGSTPAAPASPAETAAPPSTPAADAPAAVPAPATPSDH